MKMCRRCGFHVCERGCPGDGIPDTPEPLVTVPRKWLFGLTADEWLHLAAEGENSEVKPCCGNLGELRDSLNSLVTFQAEGESGWHRYIGGRILVLVTRDGDNHHLADPEQYPLLARVCAGLRALEIGVRTKTGKEITEGDIHDWSAEAEKGYDIPGNGNS
jgi:hypothetical protein